MHSSICKITYLGFIEYDPGGVDVGCARGYAEPSRHSVVEQRPQIHVRHHVNVCQIHCGTPRRHTPAQTQPRDGEWLTGHGTRRVQCQHPSVTQELELFTLSNKTCSELFAKLIYI